MGKCSFGTLAVSKSALKMVLEFCQKESIYNACVLYAMTEVQLHFQSLFINIHTALVFLAKTLLGFCSGEGGSVLIFVLFFILSGKY